MSPRRQRLIIVLAILAGVAGAVTLALLALEDNVSYFRTPTEIVSQTYPEHGTGRRVRIGGMVVAGSIQRGAGIIDFQVTDQVNSLRVNYAGIVPDLFREGQGVIADGRVQPDGSFVADKLLAKHDEKYVPPELKQMESGK